MFSLKNGGDDYIIFAVKISVNKIKNKLQVRIFRSKITSGFARP